MKKLLFIALIMTPAFSHAQAPEKATADKSSVSHATGRLIDDLRTAAWLSPIIATLNIGMAAGIGYHDKQFGQNDSIATILNVTSSNLKKHLHITLPVSITAVYVTSGLAIAAGVIIVTPLLLAGKILQSLNKNKNAAPATTPATVEQADPSH